MNIQGAGSSFDFRKIELKRIPDRPEPAAQPKAEQPQTSLSLAGQGGKLPAVLTGFKSSIDASRETASSEEIVKTRDKESVRESTQGSEESGDLTSDYEPVSERDEDSDKPDNETEEQRQKKGKPLDALEAQYRSRFLTLDQLMDHLVAAHDFLTPLIKDRSHEPDTNHRLGTPNSTTTQPDAGNARTRPS